MAAKKKPLKVAHPIVARELLDANGGGSIRIIPMPAKSRTPAHWAAMWWAPGGAGRPLEPTMTRRGKTSQVALDQLLKALDERAELRAPRCPHCRRRGNREVA